MSNPDRLFKMWLNCFAIRFRDMKKICERIETATETERELLTVIMSSFNDQFAEHLNRLERVEKALAKKEEYERLAS